jgi:hypothetical protein
MEIVRRIYEAWTDGSPVDLLDAFGSAAEAGGG